MIYFLLIYLFGLIGFFIHYRKLPLDKRTNAKTIELLLLYQLVFSVGITSFVAFIGITFMGDVVQQYTQWPACPYQQELANVNLAYGFLGILSIWFRKLFWVATVIGFSIWIFGDAIHHAWDAYVHQNHSKGNEGILFYTDLIVPILLCINLYFYYKYPIVNEK